MKKGKEQNSKQGYTCAYGCTMGEKRRDNEVAKKERATALFFKAEEKSSYRYYNNIHSILYAPSISIKPLFCFSSPHPCCLIIQLRYIHIYIRSDVIENVMFVYRFVYS